MADTKKEILTEAKERFRQAQDWESYTRQNFRFDTKFNSGDENNKYQWPDAIVVNRNSWNKPCITVNKVRQCTLSIVNDFRQNKSDIKIIAVGGGADSSSAQVFQGIIRHIESVSQAQDAYDTACNGMVIGGIGWVRLVTKKVKGSFNDQDLFIERISDPMSVYIDPNTTNFDKSDAWWGFVFNDMSKDMFKAKYPKYKDLVLADTGLDEDRHGWWSKDYVRIADYYRRVEIHDELHQLDDGSIVRDSEAKATDIFDLIKDRIVASVDDPRIEVEYYKIAGDTIIEENTWLGSYIPLICFIGEETVIDGRMDRKGHVRNLIGPQMAYNLYTSGGCEFVALQTKTPWIAPVKAIEGYTDAWNNANTENLSILPYNSVDDEKNVIPPPHRTDPPVYAPAFMEGLKIAEAEISMASGQYGPTFGAPSPERSGKALDASQRHGANQTYHYIEHGAKALRNIGRQAVEIIPKLYDTARVMKILGEDGQTSTIQVDPNHPVAHEEVPGLDPESFSPDQVAAIFNPTVGEYDVVCEVGPSFATRRQETFNALTTILSQNESLTPVVGDLLFRSSDVYLADEIAKRMRNMVPPQALGQGPTPKEQELQQHLAQQHSVIENLVKQNDELKNQFAIDLMRAQTERENADTNKFKAYGAVDPEAMKLMVREIMSTEFQMQANDLVHAHAIESALTQRAVNEIHPQGDQTAQGGAPPNQLPPEPQPEGSDNG